MSRRKFRLRKEIEKIVRKHRTFSPSKIRGIILKEYNVSMTPESITMFFKRHSDVLERLRAEIVEQDQKVETISYEMDYWITKDFKSEIPIIQEWIDTMIGRKVSEGEIRKRVLAIRKICMGLKGRDKHAEVIKDWKLHPIVLTEEKALEYIVELNRRSYNDKEARLAVRNFLRYGKGIEPKKISGDKGESGKYAHLRAPPEKVHQILDYLTLRDYRIGTFCKVLYKTATRAKATTNIKVSHINEKEKIVFVWDKGKRRVKQKWKKYLDKNLLFDLQPLIKEGRLFQDVNLREARELCREAYEKFIPEIAKEIPMPLHFFRHCFAQIMLDKTNWNYDLVAQLGGWHPKTLRDDYGEPPESIIRKAGLEYIPMI